MEVTLIRHTSVAVPKGTCYGWSDVPVASTFEAEAHATRRRLEGKVFDQAYTSPLTRARMLAAYCGFPDAIADDRLMEMNMGEWEMQRYDEIRDEALQRWYDDYMHLPATGGESFPMLHHRVSSFLNELRTKEYRHVAVFAHGGVLVSAGLYAGLYSEAEAFRHLVAFGGVMEIVI
ncbi:MAG: alpha-ribazole phosphatase [Prevotella sp.]|nr:alpha-ribazole phosphatase [Prevotella sp.]